MMSTFVSKLASLRERCESIEVEGTMPDRLKILIEEASKVIPSAADREEQRRSFAYGNTKIENTRITKEIVDREAELLTRDRKCTTK